MGHRIASSIDRGVARAAVGVTRRQALRRASEGILGASLAAVVWRPGDARADHCHFWARPYSSTRVCGPRGYCNDARCYSSGACHKDSTHQPTSYGGSSCGHSGDGHWNCWCVCSSGGYKYNCCDCCANVYQSGDGNRCCSGCAGGGACNGYGWYQCVCRSQIGRC